MCLPVLSLMIVIVREARHCFASSCLPVFVCKALHYNESLVCHVYVLCPVMRGSRLLVGKFVGFECYNKRAAVLNF